MTPTPEQAAILDASIASEESLKMLAYAGTGKTSTLVALAEQHPTEEVLYLAFNKSVETEASMRFPMNTTAKTGHALAYASERHRIGKVSSLQHWHLAKVLGIKLYESALLLKTLERFMCSADNEPLPCHVEPDRLNKFDPGLYVEGMVRKAEIVWRMFDTGQIDHTHSSYLKMFQLRKKNLAFPIVLLDEAQDTNPVMHDIVKTQAQTGARVYYVGDPYQQIYSWRGACDAMATIDAPSYRLSQSFRFGPAIAGYASRILSTFFDEPVPLQGLSSIDSLIGPRAQGRYTIICRTNSGLVREAYNAALNGARISVVGAGQFDAIMESIAQIYYVFVGQRDLVTESRLKWHRSFGDLKAYAEEALDVELASKIGIVEEYQRDWPKVQAEIKKALAPGVNADVLLTTCHKAKGLEWDNVEISEDFEDLMYYEQAYEYQGWHPRVVSPRQHDESEIAQEEVNLLYVAITRAKRNLCLNADLKRFLTYGQDKETTKQVKE